MSIEAFVAMALALGAGGLVKGAIGMGLPLVSLPILASFLGVQHAVALLVFPLLVTNIWQAWQFRSELWNVAFLLPLLVGGALGIALGTILIASLPERSLSLALAVVIFVYVGVRILKPQLAVSPRLGRQLAAPVGFSSGLLQGATGMGGPIGVTFIHAMRLSRTAHVAALSAMFLVFVGVQIPSLVAVGLLTWRIALESALAVLPAIAMVPVGAWVAGRLSGRTFDRLVMAVLVVVALQLLARNLAA